MTNQQDNAIIYDFETMSQDPEDGAVISIGILTFNFESLIFEPYDYDELVEKATFAKFDVAHQVKTLGRKICPDTLKWWGTQGAEAQDAIKPRADDIKLTDFPEIWAQATKNVSRGKDLSVWTRNNTFDPMFVRSIYRSMSLQMPYPFWTIRDTKTHIKALTFGEKVENDFIPSECADVNFVKHHPSHDVAMDLMRLQSLQFAIFGDDIPF